MKKSTVTILSAFLTISMSACGDAALPSGETALEPDEIIAESEEFSEVDSTGVGKSDSSLQYTLGDIVFSDGSVRKAEDLSVVDSSNVPIAVIAGFKDDGTAFGVGVYRSDRPLQWAADDSIGYAAGFTDIVCTQQSEGTFLGDRDGSDNWDIICAQDGQGTADAAENYPAFHFVDTYAETHNLTGDYADGWYMPSISELCEIYQNREAVNLSLKKIYELDDRAAMNGLETNWYWASSQAGAEDDYAWFVHYFNGYAGECPKNFTNVHALAVRNF